MIPALTLPLGSSILPHLIQFYGIAHSHLARMRVLEFLAVNMGCFQICLQRNDLVGRWRLSLGVSVRQVPERLV